MVMTRWLAQRQWKSLHVEPLKKLVQRRCQRHHRNRDVGKVAYTTTAKKPARRVTSTVTIKTALTQRKQLAAAKDTYVIRRYRMDKRGRGREPSKILDCSRTFNRCSNKYDETALFPRQQFVKLKWYYSLYTFLYNIKIPKNNILYQWSANFLDSRATFTN